jgi:putative nucleotidyltransferase with HDIG domain
VTTSSRAETTATPGARVLVAAPQEEWVRELCDTLHRSGFIPHRATSPEAATLATCYRNPAAVLLDSSLLRSAGFRLLDSLRVSAPRLPILVLGSPDEDQLRLKSLMLGVEDCLVRPFAPQEAVVRLRRCLQRRQEHKRLAAEKDKSQEQVERLRTDLGMLRERLQKSVHQLQRAVDFHARLEPHGDPEKFESDFLQHLSVQTGVARLAYLGPSHPAASWLVTRAAWGLPQRLAVRLRIPRSGELTRLLTAMGGPVPVVQLASMPGLRLEMGILAAGGFKACVPLLLRGELLGMVLLGEVETGGAPDDQVLRMTYFLTSALVPALAAQARWAEERRMTAQTLAFLVSQLEDANPYLRGHSMRVARIAETIGDRLGLEEPDRSRLATSALLHDIGRFEVDAALWEKQGPLSPEDWKLVHRHPGDGARILEAADWPEPVLAAVRHHHERWDGTGYPEGLRKRAIPIQARIVAVADALDALTSPRPYRGALSKEEALEVLAKEAGARYDPLIVKAVIDDPKPTRVFNAVSESSLTLNEGLHPMSDPDEDEEPVSPPPNKDDDPVSPPPDKDDTPVSPPPDTALRS